MSRTAAILILLVAATLEAVGDAIIRVGLHSTTILHRYAMFAIAAVVLFGYGWSVNAPPWDFGKLLGLYVVFFSHCPVDLMDLLQTATLTDGSPRRSVDCCRWSRNFLCEGMN